MSTRGRRRSRAVAVGAAAVLVGTLSGCGRTYDQAGVCVDRQTQQRVPDEQCDDDHAGSGYHGGGGFGWYYIGRGGRAPAVGQPVSGGSWEPGPNATRGGVSPKGETISRGGFKSGGLRGFGG